MVKPQQTKHSFLAASIYRIHVITVSLYLLSQSSLLRQQWLVLDVILVTLPLRYSELSDPNPLATLAVCYASEDEGFAPDGEGSDGDIVMDNEVLLDDDETLSDGACDTTLYEGRRKVAGGYGWPI
jgi:hypothetical protein